MTRGLQDCGIGTPTRRKEDLRLVTGHGRFVDDLNLPDQAYAVMIRSPHAHARIVAIDCEAAKRSPGVLAVLTGADVLADRLKPIPNKTFSFHPAERPLVNMDGSAPLAAPDYPLPADKARYVGEAIAMVVATSLAGAKDAAERVEIQYETLPCVTYTRAAAQDDAPKLYDEAPSNICIDAEIGDRAATRDQFERAAHIVTLRTWIPRVAGSPMEPRSAIGAYEAGRYTIYASNGSTVKLRDDIALTLDVPKDHVRLVIGDVGGNFGTRGAIYPELPLIAWASKRIGRPVKFTGDRTDCLLSDYQGRDLAVKAELALDGSGNFLAMRGSNIGNLGAHSGNFSMVQKGVEIMSSIYRMPAAHFRVRAVMSNTAPTRPYRSAGRPEVIYVMERLIDLAARQCGFDRLDLRRRNLLTRTDEPYTNPFGLTYDGGDYHGAMEAALSLGDWRGFPERREAASRRGKLRGIGVANYVDTATGIPRERAALAVRPDGVIDLIIGTISNGQGHETSFAQLVTAFLGVPIDCVRFLTGDTDVAVVGGGAHSGRGMRLGSIVIWKAANRLIAKGRAAAAFLLQSPEDEISFGGGRFQSRRGGSASLFDVAGAMAERLDWPSELSGALEGECDETIVEPSFPYGCQVCEVEIDPETGVLEIIRLTAVDDVGRAVNPLIIHGQTHGGIAQGVGQAVMEQVFYDSAAGQLLSASFMDYAMPRASDLPSFVTQIRETPCATHPLGIRPAGEGGTTPALGVVVNAVVDALAPFGVDHIEMPVTSERIWRAIQSKPPRSRHLANSVADD